MYLLGLQSLVAICDALASSTLPLYTTLVAQQRAFSSSASSSKVPPALDIENLPADVDASVAAQLRTAKSMLETAWPALLAALSFLAATNLSDALFGDVLQAYQAVTRASGALGLTTPRDAFLTSLTQSAIPPRVVSSVDSFVYGAEPHTPRTVSGALSEGFGLTSASSSQQPPGLSERNLACLKVLVSSALFLAGGLGTAWFRILEALQNAEYVLTARGTRTTAPAKRGSTVAPNSSSSATQTAGQTNTPSIHPLLTDLDSESVQRAMQRVFEASKGLDDDAFRDFISALCQLSGEMVGMQSDASIALLESEGNDEAAVSSVSLIGHTPHQASCGRQRNVRIGLPTKAAQCADAESKMLWRQRRQSIADESEGLKGYANEGSSAFVSS